MRSAKLIYTAIALMHLIAVGSAAAATANARPIPLIEFTPLIEELMTAAPAAVLLR